MSVPAVLETYELLENILLHLSPHDIQRARRVCKAWHLVIDDSKALHNARCLRPIQDVSLEHIELQDGIIWRPRPNYQMHSDLHLTRCLQMKAEPNRWNHFRELITYDDNQLCLRTSIELGMLFFLEDKKLFVTTPPCQAVDLIVVACHAPSFNFASTVYARDGIRLSDVMDVSREMQRADMRYGSGWVGNRRSESGMVRQLFDYRVYLTFEEKAPDDRELSSK